MLLKNVKEGNVAPVLYYYDDRVKSFYVSTVHRDIPEGLIEKTEEAYFALQTELSKGKVLLIIDGDVVAVEATPVVKTLTEQELQEKEDTILDAILLEKVMLEKKLEVLYLGKDSDTATRLKVKYEKLLIETDIKLNL